MNSRPARPHVTDVITGMKVLSNHELSLVLGAARNEAAQRLWPGGLTDAGQKTAPAESRVGAELNRASA